MDKKGAIGRRNVDDDDKKYTRTAVATSVRVAQRIHKIVVSPQTTEPNGLGRLIRREDSW